MHRSRKWLAPFLIVAVLLIVGWLIRPLESTAWEDVSSTRIEPDREALTQSEGLGALFGVLGGLRGIVADFFWLHTVHLWQQQERFALREALALVTSMDPRPLVFWLEGARMLAYDVPHWRFAEEGGYATLTEQRRQAIIGDQAEAGIAFLEQALEAHPEHPLLQIEIGQIHLNRYEDREAALLWYAKAMEHPDVPGHSIRIYARLLRVLGRGSEAYAFLIDRYRTHLERGQAMEAELALLRIRDLEAELGIAPSQRFEP